MQFKFFEKKKKSFSAPVVAQVIKRDESFFQFDSENLSSPQNVQHIKNAGSNFRQWNRVKGCINGKRACCLSLPAPPGKVRAFTSCCTCSLPSYALTFALTPPRPPSFMESPQWASRGRERSENEKNITVRERVGLQLSMHFRCWYGCDFKRRVWKMSDVQMPKDKGY